jgi:hypothetical protein
LNITTPTQPLKELSNPIHFAATITVKDISLDFPHFDGTTYIMGRIFKVEKFFNYHNTPDGSRVEIAAMHFDGEVVPGFQMLHRMVAVNT